MAQWIVFFCYGYLGVGVLFAIPFLIYGVERIDVAAKGSPMTFRLLILPGVVSLWPFLLLRWWRGDKAPRPDSSAHRRAVKGVPH